MQKIIRFEAYDGFNCRTFSGEDLKQEKACRHRMGYRWFEHYDIPEEVAIRERLGDHPAIESVRRVAAGLENDVSDYSKRRGSDD